MTLYWRGDCTISVLVARVPAKRLLLGRHAEVAVTPAAVDNNSAGRVPSHSKMADLLGSILNSMEKPPTVGDQESRRKARGTKRMAK